MRSKSDPKPRDAAPGSSNRTAPPRRARSAANCPPTALTTTVVVLVDGDPDASNAIGLQLSQVPDAFYVLHVAHSMVQVRGLMEQGRVQPDVVLIDLDLPDSSGLETLSACRALMDAPVIVLTGSDDHSLNQAAIASGAQDCLSKGCEANFLVKAIKYAILRYQRDSKYHRSTQDALHRTNSLLQGILESIPVAVCAFDKDLNLIARNGLYQSVLGLPDQLFCQSPTGFASILEFQITQGEFGPGEHRDALADRLSKIQQGVALQVERTRPDGTVLDIRSAPMPGGGFVTTFSDITDRHRAQAQAMQNMQLLRGAIDSIDEAFVIFNAEDRLLYCNEKYRRLYAAVSDVITPGVRFEDVVRAGAQRGQYPEAVGRVESWVAQRMALHRMADHSSLQRLSDGRVMRVIERKLPDGSSVGYRIDITDLVRATEEAQAANVAKSRFLATMSHEIRTPMNGILGMAQLLNQTGLSERDRQEYAKTVLSSGQSLLTLLNDILDLSKIEAGRMELDNSRMSPAELLQDISALFVGAARNKGLLLEHQWLGESGALYLTDAYRLRQMVSNLTANAVKFTPKGHIRITAEEINRIGLRAELEFSVTDTGVGISLDKQALLFEAFSQADSSTTREYGGSGLGLSIVSRLASLFGGKVGVKSEPGQGARFWFRIWAEVAPEADPGDKNVDEIPTPSTPQQFSGTVLVVEDNPVNCLVIEGLLATLGLAVQVVGDGQKALEVLSRAPLPDLVLMDLHMPVMDGYTATLQIRQHERLSGRKRVPVIALTADAFEDDRLHCLVVGMDDFLTKPVALETLRFALAKWLAPVPPRPICRPALPSEMGVPDGSRLHALLNHTRSLLALHKFDAIEQFEALQLAAGQSPLAVALNEVAPLVKELRFEDALALLQVVPARPEV